VAVVKKKSSIEDTRATQSPAAVAIRGPDTDYIALRWLVEGKREGKVVKGELMPDVESIEGEDVIMVASQGSQERPQRRLEGLRAVIIHELGERDPPCGTDCDH
jgi:hypothetical protein